MKTIGVCLVTYNEEKYIAQAIESVLAQKCEAKVHLYIGEDCSKDKTREICRQYYEKIGEKITLVCNENNLGLVGNTVQLLEMIVNDGCEYVAMLDGDDYWCDEQKLQKQYEFLESHEDYGFVHTNQKILLNDTALTAEPRTKVLNGDIFKWAGKDCTAVANCTAFYRTSLISHCDLKEFCKRGFTSMDYVMYVILMRYTKFQFLDDFTAVWRRGHTSVSGGGDLDKQIRYVENGIKQFTYIGELFPDDYPFSQEDANRFKQRSILKLAYRFGNYEHAHQAVLDGARPAYKKERLLILCAKNRLLFNILYQIHFKSR